MIKRIAALIVLTMAVGACERGEQPAAESGEPAPPAEQDAGANGKPEAHAQASGQDGPAPLIDRGDFFGNPDRARVRVSPDGQRLSYLANEQGVLNVFVGSLDSPQRAKAVTQDRGRGIRIYYWAYTNDHILYLQDQGGNENWTVYSVDLSSGEQKRLTPAEGVHAQIEQLSPKHPRKILVGTNERNERLHDVYRVDIVTGEREMVQKNTGFTGFVTDRDLSVRLGIKMSDTGRQRVMRKTADGAWEELSAIGVADQLSTQPLGFDAAGETLYWYDSRSRDTAALVAQDMGSGDKRVLHADSRANVQDVTFDPVAHRPQAAAATYRRKQWQPIDENIATDLERLTQVSDGELSIVDRSQGDRHWIVSYDLSRHPHRYYHYDREAERAVFLFANRKALEGKPLAPMHDVVIEARDGLKLVSYLTLPPWTDGDGDGRPGRPLPMVLFVHGGPWARDHWGYHAYHQWLTNRGYAVLSVNFRGSTGFGKQFVNAGNKEWAGKMHDDLLDGVEWAIERDIAKPDEIAIMGGSYGGYATLVGLAFTPDRFACGVDIVGPSNLITLLNSIPPYWKPQMAMFTERVGDPGTQAGRELLRERSPLTRADAIDDPLLIGQGANDPRVKQAESDQIVQALQGSDVPVTYVIYPDEGHGFARPENRLSFNAIAESFLSECIGGRHRPIGEAFEGSSLEIEAGLDYVPGLEEAWQRHREAQSTDADNDA